MRKNILLIVTTMLLTTMVWGCNMFKGAGKDIENAGEGMQKVVDKND